MVRDYTFQSFDGAGHFEEQHEVQSADDFVQSEITVDDLPEGQKQNELSWSKSSTFKISPVVKRHRGLTIVEKKNFEKKVQQKVDQTLIEVKKQGYEDGYNSGLQEGFNKAKVEADEHFSVMIEDFQTFLVDVSSYKDELYEAQRENMFKMLKVLTKWITLKEVNTDGYMERLFEKLINEVHCKTDLLVQVDKTNFEKMPDIIEQLEDKIGKLTNVRIEVDHNMGQNGIIIESPKGIIDGSLEAQFQSLNHLFREIGIKDEHDSTEVIPSIDVTAEDEVQTSAVEEDAFDKEMPVDTNVTSNLNIDSLLTDAEQEDMVEEETLDALDMMDDNEEEDKD